MSHNPQSSPQQLTASCWTATALCTPENSRCHVEVSMPCLTGKVPMSMHCMLLFILPVLTIVSC